MSVGISHITYQLPERILTNEDFYTLFPETRGNKNWERIGVDERRVTVEGETASDLAIGAGLKLIQELDLDPKSIDMLIYSSVDIDYKYPATSCIIHGHLGLTPSCGTFDMSHGCSAYVYALSVAKGLMLSNDMKRVLVLSAGALTKDVHPKDKVSRYMFGDAAAATLLEHQDEGGIGKCVFGTDSDNWDKIVLRHGGSRYPLTSESYNEIVDDNGNITSNAHFFIDGAAIFAFSIQRVPDLIYETAAKNNLDIDNIDLFVFHQANLYMIETIVNKVKINPSKVFNNMQKLGNTGGATIPIALAQAMQQGKLRKGQSVMLIGFGVGLSLSASVVVM